MRIRKYDRKPSARVIKQIGRLYGTLHELCAYGQYITHASAAYEDIFHDTILYVIYDREALRKHTDGAFTEHFLYRFRMLSYQTLKDNKQLNRQQYAYHQQRKEEQTPDR